MTLRKLMKSGVKSPGLRELFLRISWCLRSSAFVLLHSSPNLSYSGSPLFTGLGELQILITKQGSSEAPPRNHSMHIAIFPTKR